MHYQTYSKRALKSHMGMDKYTKKIVAMEFWNPDFCSSDNLSDDDIDRIIKKLKINNPENPRGVVTGYILSLIGVYNLIYKSYTTRNFNQELMDVNFDKNILTTMLTEVDLVLDLNDNLVNLIKNTVSDYRVMKFLVTPSDRFRLILKNVSSILQYTKNIHEVSAVMYNYIDHKDVLDYYIELLKATTVNYSPRIINSYETENILLNVLKLDIDLEKQETKINKFVSSYIDRGGSIDIEFNLDYNREFPNAIPLLNMIKEYHLS